MVDGGVDDMFLRQPLNLSLHYLFSPVSDINEFNYYYYIIVIIRSLSTAALNQKIVNISVAKLSQRQEGSQSFSQPLR